MKDIKKILSITLILVLALSLGACGGGDKKASAEDIAEDAVNEAYDSSKAFTEKAAAAFWEKNAGLKEADAAPDFDWVIDEKKMKTYGDDPSSEYGHASICFEKKGGAELTKEEYNAWAKKLFDATAKASDDGHNIIGWEFVGDGEDALAETTLADATGIGTEEEAFMPGWGFVKNGKNMTVYISKESDDAKESALGELLYYYAVTADIAFGLQKSMDETMDDAEEALDEYGDEIKDTLE
jgi:hypothetical protein